MKFKKTYIWNKIRTAEDALLWSIAKWHLLYKEGLVIQLNGISCACCRKYLNCSIPSKADNCKGCPVSRYMGSKFCEDTPFEDAYYTLLMGVGATSQEKDELHIEEHVKEERDFLIRVYEKYYGKFCINEFEDGPYNLMKNYLKSSFKKGWLSKLFIGLTNKFIEVKYAISEFKQSRMN